MTLGMGWVYVAKNPSIPNLIKIGMTDRDDPHTRIEELNTTGLPEPFRIEFALMVSDAISVEGALHARYGDFRVSMNREFFRLDSSQVLKDIDSVIIELGIENHRLKIFNPDLAAVEPSYQSNPKWGKIDLQEGFLSKEILREYIGNYVSEHLWFVPPEILDENLLIFGLIKSNRLKYIQRPHVEMIFNRAREERFNTLINLLLLPPTWDLEDVITEPITLINGLAVNAFIEDLNKAEYSWLVATFPDFVPTVGFKADPSLPANQELRKEYLIKTPEDIFVKFFEDLAQEIFDSSSNVSYQYRMYLYLRYEQYIFKSRKLILSTRDDFLQNEQKTLGFYLSGDVILCDAEYLNLNGDKKMMKRQEVISSAMSIYDASFLIFFEATIETGVSENDVSKFCRKLINERSSMITCKDDAENFLLLISRVTNYCLERYDGYTDEEPFFDMNAIPRTLRKFVSSEEISAIYKTATGGNFFPFTEELRWETIVSLTDSKSNFRSGLWFHAYHAH